MQLISWLRKRITGRLQTRGVPRASQPSVFGLNSNGSNAVTCPAR